VAEYRTESLADACVIEARGEVDISNVAELTRRILHVLAEGETAIVLDLAGVTHLDSSGLSAVISAHQQVTEESGGKLALVLDQKHLRRTFELRGLDRVFVICDSREQALESLRDPGQPAVTPPS
jgi:anti-sigma B factor antagonist